MGPETASDPFTEDTRTNSQVPQTTSTPSAQNQQSVGNQPTATTGASYVVPPGETNVGTPTYGGAQPYGGGYPYSSAFAGSYANNYANPYGNVSYAQPYAPAYGAYPTYSRAAFAATNPSAQYQSTGTTTAVTAGGVRAAGTTMLNSLQEAMARFARVSALVDDVLRHLHMLFDAIFGLGYTLGAVHAEARLWFAVKTGPVAAFTRAIRSVASVWRLLTLFFLSPMAGRFSPVALVLRILGLVPEDLSDVYPQNEPFQSSDFFQADDNPDRTDPDSDNMNSSQNIRNSTSNM